MSAYNPIQFDPRAYADKARKSDPEFRDAYDALADEFNALSE